ncbi:hypothetical protein CYG49_04300 [Candidatus Saccharibacteria bacterium]|nr:MAG: hypothetical protein CYG49_04300 [Candidatus Saccharibacteria bacterium]
MPQYLYDTDVKTINGTTKSVEFKVNIPPCYFQTDLMFGDTAIEKFETVAETKKDYPRILGSLEAPGNRSTGVNVQGEEWNKDFAAYNGGQACEIEEEDDEPIDAYVDLMVHVMPCVDQKDANKVLFHLMHNEVPAEYDNATVTLTVGDQTKTVTIVDGKLKAEFSLPAGDYHVKGQLTTETMSYILHDEITVAACAENNHDQHLGNVHNNHTPAAPAHAGHGAGAVQGANVHAGHVLPAAIPATGFTNTLGLALALLASASAYVATVVRQKGVKTANSTN